MTKPDPAYYEALAEKAECGDFLMEPGGQVLHGQEAVDEGRRILMWATETDTVEDALKTARRGHPRLSPGTGRSPVVRARLEESDYAALETMAEETGKTQSELVRQGVKLVLAAAAG
jgi:hypothetical protein